MIKSIFSKIKNKIINDNIPASRDTGIKFDYGDVGSVIDIDDINDYKVNISNHDKPLIAIQVHVFFVEVLEELLEQVNMIPVLFDLFISTNTELKKNQIEKILSNNCKANNICVEVFENRGRDVAPFLIQMHDRFLEYKYISHIHTKKSLHIDFGDNWRKYILNDLYYSTQNISKIIGVMENDDKIGMVMSKIYPPIEPYVLWDGAYEDTKKILVRMKLKAKLPKLPIFPAGDMFWARSEAIKPLFDLNLNFKDFPEEAGQLQLTLAHTIERVWIYLLKANDYKTITIHNFQEDNKNEKKKHIYKN